MAGSCELKVTLTLSLSGSQLSPYLLDRQPSELSTSVLSSFSPPSDISTLVRVYPACPCPTTPTPTLSPLFHHPMRAATSALPSCRAQVNTP